MKKIFVAAGVLALLVMDWAALHDIRAGEPDLTLEYATLGLSVIAVALLLRLAFSSRRQDSHRSEDAE